MVFHIDSFFYMHFWCAVWNALIYWELIGLHNLWDRPHRVIQNHWVVKLMRIMPLTSCWFKVTWGLMQLITGIRPFVTFTYWWLVDFLVLAYGALDTLGGDPITQYEVANQVIYDLFVEPAEHPNLPNNLEDQIVVEQH